jgi:hypothetical protein
MRLRYSCPTKHGELDLDDVRLGDRVRFLVRHTSRVGPKGLQHIDPETLGEVVGRAAEGLEVHAPVRRTVDGDVFVEAATVALDRDAVKDVVLLLDARDTRLARSTRSLRSTRSASRTPTSALDLMRWAAVEGQVDLGDRGGLVRSLRTLAHDRRVASRDALLETAEKLAALSDAAWCLDLEDIDCATPRSRRYATGPLGIRELKEWLRRDEEFVVVSAYNEAQPKSENQKWHGELMADLSRMGYTSRDVRPLRGKYFRKRMKDGKLVTEEVAEQSVIVFGMPYTEGRELAAKYRQDSFIHKSRAGVVGAYYVTSEGQVALALDRGQLALGEAAAKVEPRRPKLERQGPPHPDDPWSKGRSVGFEFPIDWDTKLSHDPKTPISPTQAEEQLRQKTAAKLVHYSPRPGLTELDPAHIGGGALSRSERQDTRVPVTFYYFEGTTPETLVLSLARARYEAELPEGARTLDLANAPAAEAAGIQDAYRRDGRGGMYQHIKDLGYFGFYNSDSGLPNALAVFYALPVKETELRTANVVRLNLMRRISELSPAQIEDIVLRPFEERVDDHQLPSDDAAEPDAEPDAEPEEADSRRRRRARRSVSSP